MRRSIAMLTAAAVGAGGLVLAPARPVTANSACAGQGTAVLSVGLLYPLAPSTQTTADSVTIILEGSEMASFQFALSSVGACSNGGVLNAVGVLGGYCGQSAGQGVTSDGFSFGFTSAGSVLVITGALEGVVNAVPDPTIAGNSCSTPNGAKNFLVTGAVAKLHCNTLQSLGWLLNETSPQSLTTQTQGGKTLNTHLKRQTAHHSTHHCEGAL